MEREIANVAAASAMRGFRYMVFPPIVFDAAPAMVAPTPTPEPPPASLLAPGAATPQMPPAAVDPTPVQAVRAAPPAPAATRVETRSETGAEVIEPVAVPDSPPAPHQALPHPSHAHLAARPPAPPHPAQPAPPARRFALLAEVSAELRRQGPA